MQSPVHDRILFIAEVYQIQSDDSRLPGLSSCLDWFKVRPCVDPDISKEGGLKKRSFALSGHRTSVALEPEFWAALQRDARERGLALAALVAQVDAARGNRNLASALRLHALAYASATRPPV
jgi:predicted DNA-binding ribbon-helix-helix protein